MYNPFEFCIGSDKVIEMMQALEVKHGKGYPVTLDFAFDYFFPTARKVMFDNFKKQFTLGYSEGFKDGSKRNY